MTLPVNYIYEFGPFRLDSNEGVLHLNGQEIPLRPKPFGVLLVLVRNSGHIVAKEALMDTAWPDSFVGPASLTQQISVLRQTLSKWDSDLEYIETIPKRGYRFTAPVKVIEEVCERAAGQYVVVISARIDEVDKPIAEAIEAHLKKVSKDVTLTLMRIDRGSVVLILRGTRAGFQRIKESVESGRLSKVGGFEIEEVRWGLAPESMTAKPRQTLERSLRSSSRQRDAGREGVSTSTRVAALTPLAFDSLLAWLGENREEAAALYEDIRRKLIHFFQRRDPENSEELADVTIDRVARKINEVREIKFDPLYFFRVARNIYAEYSRSALRSPAQQESAVGQAKDEIVAQECLNKCLASLSQDARELILAYYHYEGDQSVKKRESLASRLGIAPHTLRMRIARTRKLLRGCVADCMHHVSKSSSSK